MGDEDIEWYHLAACQGMNDPRPGQAPHTHRDYFYEEYEADPVIATVMDSICLSCSVRASCLREGVENNESGLWGGVFLINGKADPARNAHKTDDIWEQIRGSIR